MELDSKFARFSFLTLKTYKLQSVEDDGVEKLKERILRERLRWRNVTVA